MGDRNGGRTASHDDGRVWNRKVPVADRTAISPYEDYCDGYGMPGATGGGYVCTLKVSTGAVIKTDDALIDGIVAYDRGEIDDAYIGQINMITASSFCGLQGQVWGYDLARHDALRGDGVPALFEADQFDGSRMPVFDAEPLIDAGTELFGTEANRRFHLVPGAHTICANKGVTAYRPSEDRPLRDGECYGVWSIIAISLAKDRDTGADLFIEDAGVWTVDDDESHLAAFLESHRRAIAASVVACGDDSHVRFDRSYIGFAHRILRPGEIGTAITVGPYVTLARNAVPEAGFDALNDMSLSDWLREKELAPLTGSLG